MSTIPAPYLSASLLVYLFTSRDFLPYLVLFSVLQPCLFTLSILPARVIFPWCILVKLLMPYLSTPPTPAFVIFPEAFFILPDPVLFPGFVFFHFEGFFIIRNQELFLQLTAPEMNASCLLFSPPCQPSARNLPLAYLPPYMVISTPLTPRAGFVPHLFFSRNKYSHQPNAQPPRSWRWRKMFKCSNVQTFQLANVLFPPLHATLSCTLDQPKMPPSAGFASFQQREAAFHYMC